MPRNTVLFFGTLSLGACTGLVAGPESSQVTPVSASRDSAYARARRAMQAETFTVDVADSVGGHIVATRYAGSSAKLGSATACRLKVALDIQGSSRGGAGCHNQPLAGPRADAAAGPRRVRKRTH